MGSIEVYSAPAIFRVYVRTVFHMIHWAVIHLLFMDSYRAVGVAEA